jgi:hypothetical protein
MQHTIRIRCFVYDQLENNATGVSRWTVPSWTLRAFDHSTLVSGLPVQHSTVVHILYSATTVLRVALNLGVTA